MDKDIVDSQQGSDPNLAKQPDPSTNADVPQMGLDKVLPRQVSTGLGRGIQQLGSPDVFVDSGNNQIIVARNGINQVLMGDQSNFGEGFYVTKPGIDVTTAKDSSDFRYNSNQNVFKIIKTDVVNLTIASTTVSTVTVPHGLGYAPIVMAFLNNVDLSTVANDINIPLPTFLNASIDTVGNQVKFVTWVFASSDAFNVYIQCINSSGVALGQFPFKYYLLQETASIF